MHIHNVDLHYHAGQERAEGVSLSDHLQHARLTGRRLIGITDHLGLYLNARKPGRHYEASVDGLRAYRAELDALKPEFPDLKLYFAPEIGPGQDLDAMPDSVVSMSDFFIGEVAFPGMDAAENTDALIERLVAYRMFSDATNREIFLAHPFRSAVNLRLIKRDAEPWVSAMEPRWDGDFTVEEIGAFYMLDLDAIAAAAVQHGIPLEVNGNTQYRIRCSNIPAPLQMLWRACAYFRDRGVELVPGSDQHGFTAGIGRVGGGVPADCFNALHLTVDHIGILQRLRNGRHGM